MYEHVIAVTIGEFLGKIIKCFISSIKSACYNRRNNPKCPKSVKKSLLTT